MPSERITFAGHGGHQLSARLDRPAGPARATALMAHCFTCGKDNLATRRIAGRLSALGIAVLRFDFTGLGHSEGEFGNTGFSSNVGDLVAAARHLEGMGLAPGLLIGHSLGGAAVLKAAAEIASAKAVVTIAAPADPSHVLGNFGADLAAIRSEGEAAVTLAGRSFTIRRAFVEDVAAVRLSEAISHLGKALLILHAPRDEVVGIDNATEIFRAAKHPKSFVSLDDADHLLSRSEDAEYAAQVIAAWSSRYLDLGEPASEAEGPPEGVVRVSEASREGFLQDIEIAGGIALRADEPRSVGGSGHGPSPYQLLAAGLGACTSMTIRMYARRKDWPLDHVTVEVSHDKEHVADSARAGEKGTRIDVFHRKIRLEGDLDAEQRARLMEIADRCPVHRTLESSARIETEEA